MPPGPHHPIRSHQPLPALSGASVGSNVEVACADCPIRHRAVCARCEADELERLEDMKYYRSYEAGQPIVWAGDEMGFVASVVRGAATLSQTLPDGRRQMVGLLLPSDFLGRPGRPKAAFDVTAASGIVLCCFRRKPFEQLLTEMPHISARLLDMSLDELDAARDWMLVLGRKTAREKVASLLAILARRAATLAGRAGDVTVDLPLTREAMGDYLGLTIETVSRQISALKADGVIEARTGSARRLHVSDMSRLLAETGDDTDGGVLS